MARHDTHHDPSWPYEDVEDHDTIASDPTWQCAVGFCRCPESHQTDIGPERFSVLLCDERANPMKGARCRVLAQGILINEEPKNADAKGWITVESRGLPEQVLVEWAPMETPLEPQLPFRKLFYVSPGRADREEAARRRLHNLGFSAQSTLEENIRAFERAYYGDETGRLARIERDLVELHDRGRRPARDSIALVSDPPAQMGPGAPTPANSGTAVPGGAAAAAPALTYEQYLDEAVTLLDGIGFGRAEDEMEQPDGRVLIGYDDTFWEVIDDRLQVAPGLMLGMLKGKVPTEALNSFFAAPRARRVDCAQFCQLVLLYAHCKVLKDAGFNARIGAKFHFRIFNSSGLRSTIFYKRLKPDQAMWRFHDGKAVTQTPDELLAASPIGTRVMWTNLDAPQSSSFRNEHTLKLGPDLFAAHGFESEQNGRKRRFSRSELELALAACTKASPDAAYIRDNVFIAQIQRFRKPA